MEESEWMGRLEASRRGDVEAFGELVDQFQDAVFALAYGYVRRFHEAEDLAQEVFMRAFQSLNRLQHPAKFPSWLSGITSHVCIDWLRKRQPEGVSLEAVQAPEAPDSALGIALDEQKRKRARELDAAVQELTPECRQAVLLRFFAHRSYKEIAELTDVPTSTVRGQLYRATQVLRERMYKKLEEMR